MHGMLKLMLGKADNAEVNKRADYLRARSLALPNDVARIGFKLDADTYQHFMHAFAQIEAGNGKAVTQELVKTMQVFNEACIVSFFDEFVAVLNLGMINRKGASVTRGLIQKESNSTVEKLIPSLTDQQLKDLAAYFKAMLVER